MNYDTIAQENNLRPDGILMTALYIHIPWCIQKCPYCDFNSHRSPDVRPEIEYVDALIADLHTDLAFHSVNSISSIFIGGGTPSLFSAEAYNKLFDVLREHLVFEDNMEITLEANPGTIDESRFNEYYDLGINRLSIGIQSFSAKHLKALGRIHDEKAAARAIERAYSAGYKNINLDLMYGLPDQTLEEAMADLQQAIYHAPNHISWYQLTIEPNTVFYKQQPTLPKEQIMEDIEQAGFSLLADSGLKRYEISAFCKNAHYSKHNLNYWLFGDYLGIGAGAHGKITTKNGVYRTRKQRQPHDYLHKDKTFLTERVMVETKELAFEFMLNACRLEQTIPFRLFTECTGLSMAAILPKLELAAQKGLVELMESGWKITPFGRRFTNDIQGMFLDE